LIQIKELISEQSVHVMLRSSSEGPSFATEECMGKLVLGVVTLALSAGTALAQGYGYDNGYAAPVADLAPPAYGYAAPAYGYAPPTVAPAQAGTTIVIVTPAPAYAAPPVTAGYYDHPVPPEPIYDYAPGYWNRGYWGHWGYGRR
jgi:hypothetical protein